MNQSPVRVSGPAARSRASAAAVDAAQPQPHLVLAEQLGERAGGGDPAVVEDDHPVADPLDLADQVRVEQHGDAAGLQRQHEVADVDPAERVQRAGRLVQDDELRAGDQGDGEPEPLLHALGEAADPVAGAVGEADQRQALAPFVGRDVDPGQPDVQVEHLGGGEPRLVAEELGQVADPRCATAGRPTGRPSSSTSPASGRTRPSSILMTRGLAGAVGAEQAEHLAARRP